MEITREQVKNFIADMETTIDAKYIKEDGSICMMLPKMNIVAGKENCKLQSFENGNQSTIDVNLKTISAYDFINFIRNQFKNGDNCTNN